MIGLADIANKITVPSKVQSTDFESLSEYAKKYPYSQLFSILYLKGLKEASDIRFEEELEKHSYRISDRTSLYNLISENKEDEQSEQEQEQKPEVKEQVEDVLFEENDTTVTIGEKSQDLVDETILQHAISANYQLPELNNEEKTALKEKNISNGIIAEEIPEISPVEIEVDTKQSFNSWLDTNRNYTKSENHSKTAITELVSDTESSKEKNVLFGTVEKEKTPFFSPTQKAKESLDENTLPVSETLAKIYALQGNFPKAISAYRQLSLNNPEKKIFFAIRIKELEKKINTK